MKLSEAEKHLEETKGILFRGAVGTAIDFQTRVVDWIMACRIEDGGIPAFRTSFAKRPFKSDKTYYVMGVCVPPSTPVYVDEGFAVGIDKLYQKALKRKQISVLGFDFSMNKFVKTPVFLVHRTRDYKKIELTTMDNYTLQCTFDHLLYVKRGDKILLDNAVNVKKGDYLPTVNHIKNHLIAPYIGGLVRGDGWAYDDRHGGGVASIYQDFIQEVALFLEEIGIQSTMHTLKRKSPRKDLHYLYIPRRFVKDLKELRIFPSKDEYVTSWLRGFYDAEGWVSIVRRGKRAHARIWLVNSDLQLLKKIRNTLMERFNIKSALHKDPRKDLWYLYIDRAIDIVKFRDYIGFSLLQRKAKLDEYCDHVLWESHRSMDAKLYSLLQSPKTFSQLVNYGNVSNICKSLHRLVAKKEIFRSPQGYMRIVRSPTVVWKQVKGIKIKSGSHPFYDLTTGCHNFIANNIIVHNCWLGSNLVRSQWFSNVPEEDWEYMHDNSDDYVYLLKKYGSAEQLNKALKAPVVVV